MLSPFGIGNNHELSDMALVLEILLGAMQLRQSVNAPNQSLQLSALNIARQPLEIGTISL